MPLEPVRLRSLKACWLLDKTFGNFDRVARLKVRLLNGLSWFKTRGGGIPYKRLLGMCRWLGPHFHGWIVYNGVAFSIELLEWGRTFSDFLW